MPNQNDPEDFDDFLAAYADQQPVIENPMPLPNVVPFPAEDELVGRKKTSKSEALKLDAAQEQEEVLKEVADVQAAVADGLLQQCKDSSHEMVAFDESVIQQVRECPLDKLVAAMGELMASRLKNFCDTVDLGHPTMQDLLSRGFLKDSEFNSSLREIMTLLNMENSTTSMSRVLALLRDSFTKAKSMKDIRVSIYKPIVRALRTREARDAARSKKETKEVGLKEWLEKAKNWNDHPSSFRQFARLNNAHVEEVDRNVKKADRMNELGMTALAGSFKKRNDIINNFLGEQYCGFVKLKMIDAAIILAKAHNATFKEDYRSISFPRRVLSKFPFWLEADSIYKAKNMAPDADPENDHKVTTQACMVPDIFAFHPRAYPLHEFKLEWPQHIKDVVDLVEDHPDMLSKALFDQFWVVVPGVSLAPEMHNYSGLWVIRVGDRCELHPTAESAEKALDLYLTKAGAIHPALLGERDGKCHFLSYWN